jgi:DNA-binding transcriptional LysR family regulator
MIDLDDMRMFQALGSVGSMAAAARLINVTPPALTVRMQKLEERLGVRLVVRESRGVTFTEEGQRFLLEAIDLLEKLDAIPQRVAGEQAALTGHLRVVAPFGFGRTHVAPLVRDMHHTHPQLAITLTLSERPLANASGADLIIHIGEVKDSSWIGHVLAPNARFVCASPAFVAAMPDLRQLTQPAQLTQFPCLRLQENDEDVNRWRFTEINAAPPRASKAVNVRTTGMLSSNDGTVIGDWAVDGLGIMVRSEWDAAPLLASGKLIRLLPRWRLADAPVMALVPTRKGIAAKQRLFLEAAKRAFDPAPWRRT